ncbi:high frequency lysogenization protein HflD [uncultured Thiothrix sp.]|uniref:high frequency lysogenization protein HflD n=1 Tax=uncultured Thiothrix sp. TaxID=223185 RepID=UPI00261CB860|nr:high frequency lysogenization protein HflD [uncultured Thiothrix sp.]HMT92665.1 high frequency lysogenization protein HflD [Thiolinea sp.]
MQANNRNRTFALAALFQNVEGVNQIATTGQVNNELLTQAINSLLIESANEIEDLYGGVTGLKTGLEVLLHQLGAGRLTSDGKPKNLEATRYAVNLLYLEKKLSNNQTTFRTVLQGIESAQQQLEFFSLIHPNMIARLAELYTQTISKIGPRIIIKGEQQHLSNPDNAAKIRVLLFAGIRAALLWRQAGGDRWKLLFSRGKLQAEAQQLLKTAKSW